MTRPSWTPRKYACRILELLQQGKDPSPPDLKLVYFRDVDNRKELKVARSYAEGAMLQLAPGDIIRQIVGVEGIATHGCPSDRAVNLIPESGSSKGSQ